MRIWPRVERQEELVAFDAVPIVDYVSCGYDKGAIRHPYGH